MIANPLLLELIRNLTDETNASVSGRAVADARPERRWFSLRTIVRIAVESGRGRIERVMRPRPLEHLELPECDCA